MADNEYLRRARELRDIEKERRDVGREIRKNIGGTLKATKDIVELSARQAKLRREIRQLEVEIARLEKENTDEAKEQVKLLQAKLKLTKEDYEYAKKTNDVLKSQAFNLKNIGVGLAKSLFGLVKGVLNKALSITQNILNTAKSLTLEYMEQDSAIRRLNINIGAVGKANDRLRKTFNRSAMVTQQWGMSAKELAETYASFADETGRLVSLSEDAAEAMAKMAMGTGLGKDGAVQMANAMDSFGVSIKGTAKFVENVSQTANKLGINSGKVLKTLATNMRKLQTIRFKNGINGMSKMAMLATRLKTDMGSTLKLAEDLWEPEKAIEAAAQIQMLGGEFAKLGDPMQLMMKGRNDPAALMKDVAKAAASAFSGRGSMGELLMPTVERQRLKAFAESLGYTYEEMYEMAANERNHGDAMGLLPRNMSEEDRKMIANMAQYSGEKKGFEITMPSGEKKLLKNLTQGELMAFRDHEQALAENAEAAQSTWERIQNWWKSVKYLFNEFLMGMDGVLRPLVEEIFGDSGKGIQEWGKQFRAWGEKFGQFIVKTLWPGIQKFIAWGKSFLSYAKDTFSKKGLLEGLKDIGKTIWADFKTTELYEVLKSGFDIIVTTLKWGFGLLAGYLMMKTIGGMRNAFGPRGTPGYGPGYGPGGGGGGGGYMPGRGRTGKPGQSFKNMRKNAGIRRNPLTGKMMQSNMSKMGGRGMNFLGRGSKLLGRTLGPLGGAMSLMGAIGNFSEGNYGQGAMDLGEGAAWMINPLLGAGVSFGRMIGESIYDEVGKTGIHWKPISEWGSGGPFATGGGFDIKDAKMGYGIGGSTSARMMFDGKSTSDGHTIITPKGEIYDTYNMDWLVGTPDSGPPAGGGGTKEITINGSLMLKGEGFQKEMLRDRIFMEEFTKTISTLMNEQVT